MFTCEALQWLFSCLLSYYIVIISIFVVSVWFKDLNHCLVGETDQAFHPPTSPRSRSSLFKVILHCICYVFTAFTHSVGSGCYACLTFSDVEE